MVDCDCRSLFRMNIHCPTHGLTKRAVEEARRLDAEKDAEVENAPRD